MIYMAKTQVIDFKEFLNGENKAAKKAHTDLVIKSAGIASLTMIPSSTFAAAAVQTAKSATTFREILDTAMLIADYACIAVIIYAGAKWMLGDRTAGIAQLISGSFGYIIIRHAQDIQIWLSSL
jgi:ABC-type sugar transport system permease subunit